MARNASGIDLDQLLEDDEDGTSQEGSKAQEYDDEGDGTEDAEVEDQDDGEAEGDEGTEGQGERDEQVLTRQPGRRERAVISARKRAQVAERKVEELERQLEENRRTAPQQTHQQRQESPEEEAAKIALMTPEERMQYTLDKGLKNVERIAQQAAFNAAEAADKSAYIALASTDKLARKFAPEVEKVFNERKAKGQYVDRVTILNYLIGVKAREAASSGKPRQQRRAAEREINRQRLDTSGGRSDISSERKRGGKTLEQRLEGVKI